MCDKKVENEMWTFWDFALGRHLVAAELQQAADATEVFHLSQQGQTLLQLPFTPAAVALRNLRRGRRRSYSINAAERPTDREVER